MRVQLIVPENTMIAPDIFDRLLSASGVTAMVLFAVPLALGVIGYVVPLQIGARGVAFPRLNLLSAWLYIVGGATIYAQLPLHALGGRHRWRCRPSPTLSSRPATAADAWISGHGARGRSASCASRSTWSRRCTRCARRGSPGGGCRCFSWAATVIGYVLLVPGPVMLAALTMLMIDRHFNGVFFDSGEGGAPILYEHLAWIFFTGTYLIVLLFAGGVISEILPTFARKPIFSRARRWRRSSRSPSIGAARLDAEHVHRRRSRSAGPTSRWPWHSRWWCRSASCCLRWIATLWNGAITAARADALRARRDQRRIVSDSGRADWSVIPVGWQLEQHDGRRRATRSTSSSAGAVIGGFAALHYWIPKITGPHDRRGDRPSGASWLMLVGVQLFAFPMFLAGLERPAGRHLQVLRAARASPTYNLIASIGSFVLALGVLPRAGERGAQPPLTAPRRRTTRGAGSTLEWFALSPPPPHNFDAVPDVRSARAAARHPRDGPPAHRGLGGAQAARHTRIRARAGARRAGRGPLRRPGRAPPRRATPPTTTPPYPDRDEPRRRSWRSGRAGPLPPPQQRHDRRHVRADPDRRRRARERLRARLRHGRKRHGGLAAVRRRRAARARTPTPSSSSATGSPRPSCRADRAAGQPGVAPARERAPGWCAARSPPACWCWPRPHSAASRSRTTSHECARRGSPRPGDAPARAADRACAAGLAAAGRRRRQRRRGLAAATCGAAGLVLATIVAGGLVAGTEGEGTASEPVARRPHSPAASSSPAAWTRVHALRQRAPDRHPAHPPRASCTWRRSPWWRSPRSALRRRVGRRPSTPRSAAARPARSCWARSTCWLGEHAGLIVAHLTVGTLLWAYRRLRGASLLRAPRARRERPADRGQPAGDGIGDGERDDNARSREGPGAPGAAAPASAERRRSLRTVARLRGADQAADHLAAAADDGGDDVRRRPVRARRSRRSCWTMLGGYLAAGGAGAINHYLDRDRDARMARTRGRPLVAGRIEPIHGLVFGIVLGALAVGPARDHRERARGRAVAAPACSATSFVYTIWLKPLTPQNIVIGGAAGRGAARWSAGRPPRARSRSDALFPFAIVFFWTPPHFWALSLLIKDDYARTGVPMLPVVRGEASTRRQILAYSVLLVAITVLPVAHGPVRRCLPRRGARARGGASSASPPGCAAAPVPPRGASPLPLLARLSGAAVRGDGAGPGRLIERADGPARRQRNLRRGPARRRRSPLGVLRAHLLRRDRSTSADGRRRAHRPRADRAGLRAASPPGCRRFVAVGLGARPAGLFLGWVSIVVGAVLFLAALSRGSRCAALDIQRLPRHQRPRRRFFPRRRCGAQPRLTAPPRSLGSSDSAGSSRTSRPPTSRRGRCRASRASRRARRRRRRPGGGCGAATSPSPRARGSSRARR